MKFEDVPTLDNIDELKPGQTAPFRFPSGDIDGLKYDPNVCPQGYTPANRGVQEIDALCTYEDPDSMHHILPLVTAQPAVPRFATLQSHPDGWTECLIPPVMKRKILATPGFPAPLERVPLAHRVGPSPSGGLGLFATRPLKVGELIFAERAMIISAASLFNYVQGPGTEHLKGKDYLRAIYLEHEKTLDMAFGRLDPQRKKWFMALHNSHQDDGSGPLMGILRTNGYQVFDTPEMVYTGVFNVLSRINHSCGPNADRSFDMRTFALKLFATRNIQAGEEITTAYTHVVMPTCERRKGLAPYGFQCACPHCSDPSSDAHRIRIQEDYTLTAANRRFNAWLGDTHLPDDLLLKETKAALKVMEREGLQASSNFSVALLHICCIYNALASNVTAFNKYKARLLKLWIRDGNTLQRNIETFRMTVVPQYGARVKAKQGISVQGILLLAETQGAESPVAKTADE